MILMSQSCDEKDCHRTIEIINNSNKDIWLGESGVQHNGLDCRQVPGLIPKNENYKLDLRSCWEDSINKGYQGSVVFYLFEENYFFAHSLCDSIEYNQSVIERREYTVDDLDSLNWVIVYP